MSTTLAPRVVSALLREGKERLEGAGWPMGRQDAEWLLALVLGVGRFDLYLDPRRQVAEGSCGRYLALIERRLSGEPLQYLLGFEDFAGLRLRVTPDVLIPRPETEGLVEWAVATLGRDARGAVADIGTGSGAIACALAVALPGVTVLGVDVSPVAIAVAAGNIRALELANRVRLVVGDLLDPLGAREGGFDLIVSNPPYLRSGVICGLPREVSGFEPRLALDGGPDGLRVIRRIVGAAPAVLRPGGRLLMEIGEEQAGPVASLMAAEGFSGIASRLDLRGVERYISGCLGEPGPEPPAVRGVCG